MFRLRPIASRLSSRCMAVGIADQLGQFINADHMAHAFVRPGNARLLQLIELGQRRQRRFLRPGARIDLGQPLQRHQVIVFQINQMHDQRLWPIVFT